MAVLGQVIDGVFRIGGASECILALVSGYPSAERLNRALVMLHAQAFIDDSGKEPPVFVLAGFLASAAAWASFSDEWDAALREAQPHRIEYVKMRDANALEGEFSGFNAAERQNLLNKLWGIIGKHAEAGIVTYLNEEYLPAFKGKFSVTLDNPYLLLATRVMFGVIDSEYQRGLSRPVDFIFDQQHGQDFDVINAWNFAKQDSPRKYRKRMGASPVWGDEKYLRPLQAADMAAWSFRRGLSEIQSDEKRREIWNSLPLRIPLIVCRHDLSIQQFSEALEHYVKRHDGSVEYETAKERGERRKVRHLDAVITSPRLNRAQPTSQLRPCLHILRGAASTIFFVLAGVVAGAAVVAAVYAAALWISA